MDLKNLVDVSPFLLFEATADSDQIELISSEEHSHPSSSMDYATDQHRHVDNDDAESCSYDASDGSSSSCVSDDLDLDHDFDFNDGDGACCDVVVVVDDDDEVYWPGHGFVAKKASASGVSVSNKEVMVMNEMEKNRLFWEACLAS